MKHGQINRWRIAVVIAGIVGALTFSSAPSSAHDHTTSSAAAAARSGSLQSWVRAVPYQATLDWDHCRSSSGNYMYLEDHNTTCANHGWTGVWSFSYASNPSGGVSTLEVCHSGDHSATTVMHYLDSSGYHTLSDAGGGGCALASSAGLDHFYVTWGDATSPSI
jgi:hypothetical protein